MLRVKRWLLAWLSLTVLLGCGGDTSVAICFGDAQFCAQTFQPVANAGADQTVSSGSVVTLDGSASDGEIDSYSWAQTGGPAVSLSGANSAIATFIAPFVSSAVTLTFQLTVVGETKQADTDSTNVFVQP